MPLNNIAYLSIGGNLGDPRKTMAEALRHLDNSDGVSVEDVSCLYLTPPWGKTDQPDFFNAAAKIKTTLAARALLDLCLQTELELKRVRTERWGPRAIDIDLLWYEGISFREEGLEIPHPRMLERAFVLLPLADIAPELDLSGTSARERASLMDSTGIIRKSENGRWWRESMG